MSTTLNLADRVLARGRNLHEVGRYAEALRLLRRLAGWQQLPAAIAEETHTRLAEIHLQHGGHARARPHLAALLEQRPDDARYHYWLATAYADKELGDELAAEKHYRQSLELDPDQVDCLSDFGRLALRLGKEEEGLRALRRAVALAPDDPDTLRDLADALCRAGQSEEAQRLLRAARFRRPRDLAFQKLWNDFRFQEVQQAQQVARHSGMNNSTSDEPVLLPFRRPAHSVTLKVGKRRPMPRQGSRPFAVPRLPRPARVSDQKRA